MADSEGEFSDPAEAFEALRAEVASLRATTLELAARATEAPPASYTITLSAIVGGVKKVEDRLARLEERPAYQLTVEEIAGRIRAEGAQQRAELERSVGRAEAALQQAAREFRGEVEQARTAYGQNWRLLQMGGGAFLAGAITWAALSGPLARALPVSWAVPEKMAAATLGEERWTAAEDIARSVDRKRWANLTGSAKLVNSNVSTITACLARARKTGRSQRCSIRVDAEGGR